MQIEKQDLENIIRDVVKATVLELGLGKQNNAKSLKSERSAYQKTEQLLYNYMGFKRIVEEKKQEIADLRKYGVPRKGSAVVQYGGNSGSVHGLVLEEERVEDAVHTVQESVHGTVQAIALIDKCMATLKNDPYYDILVMRYFKGRTQEDIAAELKCSQVTVSKNKARLVKELSMRLFPDQAMEEMFN